MTPPLIVIIPHKHPRNRFSYRPSYCYGTVISKDFDKISDYEIRLIFHKSGQIWELAPKEGHKVKIGKNLYGRCISGPTWNFSGKRFSVYDLLDTSSTFSSPFITNRIIPMRSSKSGYGLLKPEGASSGGYNIHPLVWRRLSQIELLFFSLP